MTKQKVILSKQKANGIKPDVNGWAGGLLSEKYFEKMKQYAEKVNAPIFSQENIKTYGKICKLEGMKLIAEKNRLKSIERIYKGTLDQMAKENDL